MNYIGLALFLGFIVWITHYQALLFAANKPFSHGLWTWIFGGIITVFWVFDANPWADFFPLLIRDWAFLLDLVLEHLVFFNPILNKWRKLPMFYIHSDDHGSWFDRQFIALENWWAGSYIAAWCLAAAGFITLTIFYL